MKIFITVCFFFLLSCTNLKKNNTSKAFKEKFEKNLLIYTNKNNTFLHNCYKGGSKKELEKLKLNFLKMKNNPKYWNKIGACYFMISDYGKAEFYFDTALEKANGAATSDILNNKGVLLFHLKHYQQALSFFAKASRRNPQHLVPQINLASLYVQFHQYDLAKKTLDNMNQVHKNTTLFKSILKKLKHRKTANQESR